MTVKRFVRREPSPFPAFDGFDPCELDEAQYERACRRVGQALVDEHYVLEGAEVEEPPKEDVAPPAPKRTAKKAAKKKATKKRTGKKKTAKRKASKKKAAKPKTAAASPTDAPES